MSFSEFIPTNYTCLPPTQACEYEVKVGSTCCLHGILLPYFRCSLFRVYPYQPHVYHPHRPCEYEVKVGSTCVYIVFCQYTLRSLVIVYPYQLKATTHTGSNTKSRLVPRAVYMVFSSDASQPPTHSPSGSLFWKRQWYKSTAHNCDSVPSLINTNTIVIFYMSAALFLPYYMPYCATHTRIAIRLARGGDDAAPPPPQATSTSLQSLHSTKAACILQILSSLNTNRNVRQSKSSSQSYPPW